MLYSSQGHRVGHDLANEKQLVIWPVDQIAGLYGSSLCFLYTYSSGFPAGVAGDAGLIRGSGRSPGGGNTNPPSFIAEITPWTEETGSLQFMGSQRVGQE